LELNTLTWEKRWSYLLWYKRWCNNWKNGISKRSCLYNCNFFFLFSLAFIKSLKEF